MKKQLGKKGQTAASFLFAAFVCFFILSFSISVPILFRPFYYWHIDAYDLTKSGFSKIQIIQGFDLMLDYCTFKTDSFSTGVFKFTPYGASHFADCRRLFLVDFLFLAVSSAGIVVSLILKRLKLVGELRLGRFGAAFFGALSAILLPVVVGIFAIIDFDAAYFVFHIVMFPGKSNWLLDASADQIIRVLPQEFFANCAILIAVFIVVISFWVMIASFRNRRKKSDLENAENCDKI